MGSGSEIKVLIAASEMVPFAKTGGLADVVPSLAKALSRLGNVDVRTVIPKYRTINDTEYGLEEIPEVIHFDIRGKSHEIKVKFLDSAEAWRAYFIENDEYFGREGFYGYGDDAQRFAFFARAVLEMAKTLDFRPDVIHCNDWHTGLIPTYLKTIYREDPFLKNSATIFTVHNLAYQGVFPKEVLPELELGWEEFTPERLEFWGEICLIKGGLVYSDIINTVSEKYAEEIQTPQYGERLDGLLRHRKDVLHGIINGLDYSIWDPATDGNIARNYDISSIEDKVENKLALQRENNISEDPQTPLLGVVSRLSHQKGLDMIGNSVYEMVSLGAQLVLLGTGDEDYRQWFQKLANDFPGRIGVNLLFSEAMARRIYAGSDMFLMPSRYEPCGLGQLIAMRYGTIPIVRRTGGLVDTVQEYNPATGDGTGFCFDDESSEALMSAIKRGLNVYYDKVSWRWLVLNAMKKDFSWTHSAEKYLGLYREAIQIHNS